MFSAGSILPLGPLKQQSLVSEMGTKNERGCIPVWPLDYGKNNISASNNRFFVFAFLVGPYLGETLRMPFPTTD